MIGPNIEPAPLAIISGFVATLAAVILRNKLLYRLSGAGPDSAKIPGVVAVFALIASLAGSLGAKELLDQTMGSYSTVWLGKLMRRSETGSTRASAEASPRSFCRSAARSAGIRMLRSFVALADDGKLCFAGVARYYL